jgi:hypothetical protein
MSDDKASEATRKVHRPGVLQFIRGRFGLAIKMARLTTFVVVVALLGFGFRAHQVHGQLDERMLQMGEVMMRYEGAIRQDETRVVMINGEQLQFSSGVTEHTVGEVLDNFETVCEQHDAGLVERFARMPERLDGHRQTRFRPIMRGEGGAGGYVVCLDMGQDEMTFNELRARFDRFEDSSDVHDVGDIRYVYAQETDDPAVRHFVTFWTNGHFRFRPMMNEDGDAPGTDLTDVPRPPGSRRMITASEVGQTEAAVMYAGSPMSEWELEHFYTTSLAEHGWEITPIADERQPQGSRVVTAHRPDDSELLFVSLDTDARGQGTATVAVSR